jgi:VWFA-related protein
MPVRLLATFLLLLALSGMVRAAGGQKYQIDNDSKQVSKPYLKDGVLVYDVTFRIEVAGPEGQADEGKDVVVITEDGREAHRFELRKIRSGGMAAVLVLDISGSMAFPREAPKMAAMQQAATRFIEGMPRTSRATVLPFSSTVMTPQTFTNDRRALQRRIQELTPRGGTALYDAALAGVETLAAENQPGKRFVVLLTDGVDEDPGSRHDPAEVTERARANKVALYVVGLGAEGEVDARVLSEMAVPTGGRYIPVRDARQLEEIYSQLAVELQSTYTVTFPSLYQVNDGRVRPIDISIQDEKGNVVSNVVQADIARPGLVIPEVDYRIYLVLLGGLLVLLYLPSIFRQSRPQLP